MLRTLIKSSRSDTARCVFSAVLLVFAYPTHDIWAFAFLGLVPLMTVLDGKDPWTAFCRSYFCGFLFFAGTLFWFFHLTRWFSYIAIIGVLLLFSYLALYFGLFGLSYSLCSRRSPLFKLVFLPSIWVVLEFIRGVLFTGFDWVCLGHSQYTNLPIIQIADVTGVYGVTFFVVMVNVLLKENLSAVYNGEREGSKKTLAAASVITVSVLCSILWYGSHRLSASEDPARQQKPFTAAVIQANIPQEEKWREPAWPGIMEQYIGLTEQAAGDQPDLIIWPESSYPGYLGDHNELFEYLQETVRRIGIPLLLGSVVHESDDYYNTALLLSENGDVVETYKKIHLVPFGEFLPLRNILPFLVSLVAIGDFSAGDQWTVFSPRPPEKEKRFSVLICFEDTVARLSRQFVRQGAQLLVNITNDAWFGDSRAPYMHLQSSVFRTIENRRGLIRAANTGVSCFIDRWGKISNCVERHDGSGVQRTYLSGYALGNAAFHAPQTFYTKYGDVFTFACFGCILLGIIRRKSVKNKL